MTDTNIPTSEVLYRAADLIDERGLWRAGHPETSRGHCASTAISANAVGFSPAHQALMVHLGADPLEDNATVIFDWNDAPGRTADEVIEVLRAAAVIEAAKERADVFEVVAR